VLWSSGDEALQSMSLEPQKISSPERVICF